MRHTATQAIFQKKRHKCSELRKWVFGGLGILLFSACSLRLAPQKPFQAHEASFFAMGTRWSVSLRGAKDAEEFQSIKDKLISFALYYDLSFSDWSDESELRKLEKNGLKKSQGASELFIEALLLAQEAYDKTNQLFDITTGAVTWGALSQPVGLDKLVIDKQNQSFYFKEDPLRLSFGGLVKGMAVGEMSSFLISKGVNSFWIDAGGGDRASFEEGRVRFESRSRVFKAGSDTERHIHSTKNSQTYLKETVAIVCVADRLSRSELVRWGALTDAFSTARILGDDWDLPLICQEK